MKIHDYRDPTGRFAKKRRRRINRVIVGSLIIIAIIYILSGLHASQTNEEQTKPITSSEIERIMNEEKFKQETILRARKVANDGRKAKEEARHDTEMKAIEQEYESIRASELALIGTSSKLPNYVSQTSLK